MLIRDFKNKVPLKIKGDVFKVDEYFKHLKKGTVIQRYLVYLNKKLDMNKLHKNILTYGEKYATMTQVIRGHFVFTAVRKSDDAVCVVDDEGFFKFSCKTFKVEKLPSMKEVKKIFNSLCIDLFYPANVHKKLRNKYLKDYKAFNLLIYIVEFLDKKSFC